MAIDNVNVIDGIATDSTRNALVLLITDHLTWKNESNDTLSEYEHLTLLQEKINAYVSYLESNQYKEQYPEMTFDLAVIEIHFKYDISENCEKFLQSVQDQLGQYGIKIEAFVE